MLSVAITEVGLKWNHGDGDAALLCPAAFRCSLETEGLRDPGDRGVRGVRDGEEPPSIEGIDRFSKFVELPLNFPSSEWRHL